VVDDKAGSGEGLGVLVDAGEYRARSMLRLVAGEGGAMTDSWGFPAPVRPGKEDAARAMAASLRARMPEWDESHRRAGITLERTYLMHTPQGGVFVEYGETTTTFGASLGAMLGSGANLDRWIFSTFCARRRADSRAVQGRTVPPGSPQCRRLY
jgi:hypothetical protein